MMRFSRFLFALASFVLFAPGIASAQQVADPEFDSTVDRPEFKDRHPLVLVDAAHNNYHTAEARYKPFAELVQNDGFDVKPNAQKFTAQALNGCAILVIANAQAAPEMNNPTASQPAFEPAECDAVYDWIKAGGAVLLIADHHPWGTSNDRLATKLGIEMGKSPTVDPVNSETGFPGRLNFTRVNKLLGSHPIIEGRDGSERIDRVMTFAGQSLRGPRGSEPLLKLGTSAVDQPKPKLPGRTGPARGRAQGIAFTLGKGRVVALGEAGMLSAQVQVGRRNRMGMNVPGIDNKQFAINAMHWLAGVKFPTGAEAIAAASKSSDTTKMSMSKPAKRPRPDHVLSSAEIATESEASIAMITGDGSVGTGFLVRPGLVATNAHVIDDEFASSIRVRFPSAPEKAQQGPFTAELLYQDDRRDLAFLRVKSPLPPLRIVDAYTFHKGEDVTVIGNPGAGGQLILENAISRGLMSTKTAIEGERYYQLSIAVNPGNSGGPVFNSYGEVIGVVTRKSAMQEALAFCVPVEDLNLAIEKVVTYPQDKIEHEQSRHRLYMTVKGLGGGGVLYCSAITLRRDARSGATNKLMATFYDAQVAHLERQTIPRIKAAGAQVRDDNLVSKEVRDKVGQLTDNLDKLKALHDAAANPVTAGNDTFPAVRATHRRLLVEVCKTMKLAIPEEVLAGLGDSPGATGPNGVPKKRQARPAQPKESQANN
jgi:S1-C subfamily serine protease